MDEVLCAGWIDSVRYGTQGGSCIRITPRRQGSVWSARNVGRVEALRAEGRMLPAGEAAFARRREDRTAIYAFERELELDADAAAALETAGGLAFFEAQSKTYRRGAASWSCRRSGRRPGPAGSMRWSRPRRPASASASSGRRPDDGPRRRARTGEPRGRVPRGHVPLTPDRPPGGRGVTDRATTLTPDLAASFAEVALGHVAASTRTRWTTSWTGPATCAGRATCTRSSSAASTGTPASTATGRWPPCCACTRTSRRRSAIRALFDDAFTPRRSPPRPPTCRGPRRAASSAPTAGAGCSSCRPSSWPTTTPLGGGRTAAARRRLRRPLPRTSCRSPTTRSAPASIPPPPSPSRLASDYAEAPATRSSLRLIREPRPAPGTSPTATRQAWEPSRRRFPVAHPGRRPSACAALLPARRFRAWFARLPAAAGRRRARDAVRPGRRHRPHRRQDRAPRRPEPLARLVLARDRRGAARDDPPRPAMEAAAHATSPPACRTWPATTWASTGWPRSRCWR